MNQITILLAPTELYREFYLTIEQEQLALNNLDRYVATDPFFTHYEDEDAAEEAFDLTNNPSRQREREEIYGRGRSVSVGDIVLANGKRFLCLSMGWRRI